jgi:hypothetical protein
MHTRTYTTELNKTFRIYMYIAQQDTHDSLKTGRLNPYQNSL